MPFQHPPHGAPIQRRHTLIGLAAGALLAGLIGIGYGLNRRHFPLPAADVGLVFGTGLPWKAKARIRTAAQLVQQGRVGALIVSGGVIVPGTAVTEASFFRQALIERGVPAERILLEDRATNTAENVAYSLPIIQAHGFRRIVLIMSNYEGLRAHATARRAWQGQALTIFDHHAPSPGHWNPWTWWLSQVGWRLTWDTVSRLFRYRLWRYVR